MLALLLPLLWLFWLFLLWTLAPLAGSLSAATGCDFCTSVFTVGFCLLTFSMTSSIYRSVSDSSIIGGGSEEGGCWPGFAISMLFTWKIFSYSLMVRLWRGGSWELTLMAFAPIYNDVYDDSFANSNNDLSILFRFPPPRGAVDIIPLFWFLASLFWR